MEGGSTSQGLITREMQVQTTVRYHLTASGQPSPTRQEITNAVEDAEKREPPTLGGDVT